MTGSEYVNLVQKRLLGLASFREQFLEYLQGKIVDLLARVYDLDGTFGSTAVAITADGNDKFQLAADHIGTDGSGHLLTTDRTAPVYDAYCAGVQFENASAIDYDVALHYVERPSGVQINPRTGYPEYDNWQEVVGERADPDSVAESSGAVQAVINSVAETGVSNAGRKCLVWKVSPEKTATSEGVAIEECTVQWGDLGSGNVNYIETTTAALGQSTISTTASDYQVLLLGPTVRRNTDLEAAADYWFVGQVTGAGAGNPPSSFDMSDQRLIDKSLSEGFEDAAFVNVVNSFTRRQEIVPPSTEEALTIVGNAGDPPSPNDGGHWRNDTDNQLKAQVNGDERIYAEEKKSRVMLISMACGATEHSLSTGNPHWQYAASNNAWESQQHSSTAYTLNFPLNGLIPQGVTVTQIRAYVYAGTGSGSPNGVRVIFRRKVPSSAPGTIATGYDSGSSGYQWITLSSLTEVLETDTYDYYVEIRAENVTDANSDLVQGLEVTFTDGDYISNP